MVPPARAAQAGAEPSEAGNGEGEVPAEAQGPWFQGDAWSGRPRLWADFDEEPLPSGSAQANPLQAVPTEHRQEVAMAAAQAAHAGVALPEEVERRLEELFAQAPEPRVERGNMGGPVGSGRTERNKQRAYERARDAWRTAACWCHWGHGHDRTGSGY